MARNINKRLTSLGARRSGIDRLRSVGARDSAELLRKGLITEEYQKRAVNQPNTRYALGAMQEVDAGYTRISIETAERVAQQLGQGLAKAGLPVHFRLQGSVPLNTHIRGVSDVDLLTLDADYLTYHVAGVRSRAGFYGAPAIRTSLAALSTLRRESEKVLANAYPAATLDTSGSKAVHISGGSLARPVDVVPAHWLDTREYQASLQEHDRAVTILDKSIPDTFDNWPFLHIKRITDRDTLALKSLKKAIRLCKNVKSDAEEEGTVIALGSYDVAAIMYYADLNELQAGAVYELRILAETQRFLDWLYCNKAEAEKLMVPDGSRRIFSSQDKFTGLLHLSLEMDDLMKEVAKEQDVMLRTGGELGLERSRKAVSSVYIPAP